ncbi:MAG: UDP-N-acetylglucosamine 2-epimerase [Parcubacteria group bacterium GW2011_GWA1_48_11b]|nr:MAG: UDP-N-acetylglucosamine 2-epimerase [Parcubacteria group bacterium GW2011_GWA1_48_11b]
MELHGSDPVSMAKSVGLGVLEFATCFNNLKPDIVIALVDRYENFASAIASATMNIPTAHIQGGEVTGTIDESLRHAMTKLSHIHFPATSQAKERIVRMGEDPRYVFDVGCPATDALLDSPEMSTEEMRREVRALFKDPQADFDPSKPYMMVIQHPVTTEYGSGINQAQETLEGIKGLGMQIFMLWPNIDAGSGDVSRGIRLFRLANPNEQFTILGHTPHKLFVNLLRKAKCLVGNSSSGIRESCYFGLPTVNIGTRQKGREHGKNVIHAGYSKNEIRQAVLKQLEHGNYPTESIYGNGDAGEKIAKILAETKLPSVQKRLYEGS